MSYSRGSIAILYGEFVDGSGSFIDAATPLASILNPSAVVVISPITPVHDSLGHYHYSFSIPADAPLGTWTIRWTGTVLGSPETANEAFDVALSATWTYSGDPSSSLLDAVRFLVQDTDVSRPLIDDAELAWLLTQNGDDVYQAAIAACTALAAQHARRADKTTGDLQIRSSSISKQYMDLRETLAKQAKRFSPATPYAGGIRVGDGEIDRDDDDMIHPAFRVQGMDTPGGVEAMGDVTRDFI